MTEFIGMDGEGAEDENGKHVYWLFCDSEGGVYKKEKGIPLLDFILRSKTLYEQYPTKKQIFYAGDYDIKKMLQHWMEQYPQHLSQVLEESEPIKYISKKTGEIKVQKKHWDTWPIQRPTYELVYDILSTRKVRIKFDCFDIMIVHIPGKFIGFEWAEEGAEIQRWTVYDGFSFFGCSFVKALEVYGVDCNLALIKEGKQRRGGSAIGNAEDVKYCLEEVRALASLMKKFDSLCSELGYDLTSWTGPGALVKAMMKSHGIYRQQKRRMGHTIELEPEHARATIARAFTAAHIECYGVGIFKNVYGYDIRSGYPHFIRDLPSLNGATYDYGSDIDEEPHQWIEVKWKFPDMDYYPLWHRNLDRSSIQYPSCGWGWYYKTEYLAALRWARKHGLEKKMSTKSVLTMRLASDEKPFAFVEELYEKRREYNASGEVVKGNVLKLAMNSIYGKTAQQVGGSLEKLPPFLSFTYAGIITAGVRSMMTNLVTMHENESKVIAIQTDGLYTTERLTLPLSTKLGEYSEEHYKSFLSIGAGIYYTEDDQGKMKRKGRGVGIYMPDDSKEVIEQVKKGSTVYVMPKPQTEEALNKRKSFISLKAYCARRTHNPTKLPKDWDLIGQWVYQPRDCDLTGDTLKRVGLKKEEMVHAYTVDGLRTKARFSKDHTSLSTIARGCITVPDGLQYESVDDSIMEEIVGRHQ